MNKSDPERLPARSEAGFCFVGEGDSRQIEPLLKRINPWGGQLGPWRPRRGEAVPDDEARPPEHPANYAAAPGLADAVNTAIALGKPLLVTGSPGTGKSQLAERIAWEFNLGPVLRFEAQSLSEANDLFYRFDLVGHLAAVELLKVSLYRQAATGWRGTALADASAVSGLSGAELAPEPHHASPDRFVKLGPLGEAIVRSDPGKHARLFDAVFAPGESAASATPRPSVVLIDEIDKASRDFPNDLLNGIDRLEFGVRELGIEAVAVNVACRPIVIITSNSERELPAPFLRRCTFFHIEDPTEEQLAAILVRKFFANGASAAGGASPSVLPPFYRQLLGYFLQYRQENSRTLQYLPGTSELIDWTRALLDHRKVSAAASFAEHFDAVCQTASTVAKQRNDLKTLREFLKRIEPGPAAA